jgi:hypothetical protein
MRRFPPSRIVCLTEGTVETLYLLGEQDRIVGVSGYAVRPPRLAIRRGDQDTICQIKFQLTHFYLDGQSQRFRNVHHHRF